MSRYRGIKPQFVHDCSRCIFLGREGAADLYYCDQGGSMPTVIARHGDDGPEYISGLASIDAEPLLAEAARRATERNLLKPQQESSTK